MRLIAKPVMNLQFTGSNQRIGSVSHNLIHPVGGFEVGKNIQLRLYLKRRVNDRLFLGKDDGLIHNFYSNKWPG